MKATNAKQSKATDLLMIRDNGEKNEFMSDWTLEMDGWRKRRMKEEK